MLDLKFDTSKLDDLMAEAGIEVLIINSKHNIQYLLGGYRFFFFEAADAAGLSRYLPLIVYRRGRPEDAVYIGNPMERDEEQLNQLAFPNLRLNTWGTIQAIDSAISVAESWGASGKIGIESGFLPADAFMRLTSKVTKNELVDAVVVLERLRAIKTDAEIVLLREASERVVASMLAVLQSHAPGCTKRDLNEALRREEVNRGLVFDYCLITAGTSLNRAPTDQVIKENDIISLDSGANYHGYIGDLCRMGIFGKPDSELVDLLGEIEEIQQSARKSIGPGNRGADCFEEPTRLMANSKHSAQLSYMAHGMGLVSHEAPRLSDKAPQGYPAFDAERPLEPGMIISVETTLLHPKRGFIKLEDTILVTATGHESLGDTGRGWSIAGR